MTRTDARRAFTLQEVMIVVAIIVIITAIAIPSLLGARKSANERAAVQYMKAWLTAQEMYRKKHDVYADADEQLVAAKLMTVTKGDGGGYQFALDNPPGNPHQWWGRGWPQVPGTSGDRYFWIDIHGVVRYAHGRQATKDDPPIDK